MDERSTACGPRARVRVAAPFAARIAVAVCLVAAAGLSSVAAPARAAVPRGARASDGVVVKLRSGETASAASLGGRGLAGLGGGRSVLKLDADDSLPEVLGRLARDPRVEWAEPNVRYRAAIVPDDPCLSGPQCGIPQWGPGRINAFDAWNVSKGSSSVRVAVIDGGVASHPQLVGKVDFGGDFTGAPVDDCDYHGTHVAGTIAALTDDGEGVAGIGWNTRVVSYRVLSNDGTDCTGTLSSIAAAIDKAVRDGVRVINLSLAGTFDSRTIRASVAGAVAAGAVVVAAAGNEGQTGNPVQYPAAYPDVLSVAATDPDDRLADLSERGLWIDVAAPGVAITSTVPDGPPYSAETGTSMATPHVSAVAALLFAANPAISGKGVVSRIQAFSDPYDGGGTLTRYGRLNAYRALVESGPGSWGTAGYWMVATDGGIFSFGSSPFFGSTGSLVLNEPVFAMAATPTRRGYWFVARDGGIFNYGDARFFGSLGGTKLPGAIVGMAATPTGKGYWMAGADGSVYAFGDAKALGSVAKVKLAAPIVGMAATTSGNGYWLVAADGAVWNFGDAHDFGSMAGRPLNRPVVGMSPTITGEGYWLVATDGGIFSFGDAEFRGSTGAIPLNRPIVGMRLAKDGDGYWLVASDGGIFAFNTPFLGSMGGKPLNQPVVGMG